MPCRRIERIIDDPEGVRCLPSIQTGHSEPLAKPVTDLSARVERHAHREGLLPNCANRPLQRASNLRSWRLLPSEPLEFANIVLGPFTALCRNSCHIDL